MTNYVDAEVAKASFKPEQMEAFLFGGEELVATKKRFTKLFDENPLFDKSKDPFLSRQDMARKEVERSFESVKILRANKDMLAAHSPLHGDGKMSIGGISNTHSGLTDHYGLFVYTLLAQGSKDQVREYLNKALSLQIIGTYAQTELGHGSNVRALETTATFDKSTDEFVVNMPTITAAKWWPGALGLLATHAIIYARLIIDGKDHGFNAFIVQIRDENHKPMPGVEVGDVGPKIGLGGLDSGYCIMKDVRIPRGNMLSKFQSVAKDGTYTKAPPHLAKIAYVTMMKTRVLIARGAGAQLAKHCCIGIRYNIFRHQGFVSSKKGIAGGEMKIMDYKLQQMKVFPPLATAYAMWLGTKGVQQMIDSFDAMMKEKGDAKEVTQLIPALHATSAGMKAFTTEMSCLAGEEVRKCCGGQGYALSSGIAQSLLSQVASVTYEGDRIPMALQTARALVAAVANPKRVVGVFSYLANRKGGVALSTNVAQLTGDVNHLSSVWQGIAVRTVYAAAMRLHKTIKSGKTQDQAWNLNHVPLIAAAYAHTLYSLVKAFADEINGLTPAQQSLRPVLTRLCALFALTRVAEISTGYSRVTPKQARALDDAVTKLLSAIRPDAAACAESWGFTEHQLCSCIARKDGKIYETVIDWARANPVNHPSVVENIHADGLSQFLNKKYLSTPNAAPKL